MKFKIILLLAFFSLNINLFSQEQSKVLDEISSEFSNFFANEILIKNKDIKKACNNKDTVLIHVNFLYNSNGEQTNLSKELGYRITKYLQKDLNNVILRQVFYKLSSPYDIEMPTNEEIEKTKQNDYTLTGEYSLNKSGISLSKFTMSHIHSQAEFIFKDYQVKTNSISILEELDGSSITADPFKNLMEFKKDNVILKSVNLTKNKTEESSTEIDGIGQVYKTKYDVDYNIKLELSKNAYIYALFYDPGDTEHKFLWAIENDNTEFKKGTYEDFFAYNLNFYETVEAGQYSFVKIIISKDKIDIDKYYTKKFIDGYETTIIQADECIQLIDDIKTLSDIQTKTIILTF
ncbi:MAG: hypothetical protein JXL97_19480 [Bacteroidales bacterium]|nr:hypothetical protein [Bacteroidales bacterium]